MFNVNYIISSTSKKSKKIFLFKNWLTHMDTVNLIRLDQFHTQKLILDHSLLLNILSSYKNHYFFVINHLLKEKLSHGKRRLN